MAKSVITGLDVKRLRNKLSMSQQQFATALRLSTATVSRWEVDKSVAEGYSDIVLSLLIDALATRRCSAEQIKELLAASQSKREVTVTLVRLADSVSTS